MTIQTIEKEISARIALLEQKQDGLVVREMAPKKMQSLKAEYEKELSALYAARREIKKYFE